MAKIHISSPGTMISSTRSARHSSLATIAWSGLGLALYLVAVTVQARTFTVGRGLQYERPSDVADVARDGDVIEIRAGVYSGDVAAWRQNNLTLRGVGGEARLRADGAAAEGKAIWVIKGNETTIENIQFSGAKVEHQNGAGIRQEGAGLVVRRCRFVGNENGILTGDHPDSEILIENSIFARNGYGDGYSHNMYIGRIRKFTLRHSYVHEARVGHQVKSRARENHILYNTLMDGRHGNSSYIIDLPNDGVAYVVGNVMQQGRRAENWALIHSLQNLYLVNNTLVNDRGNGIFVDIDAEVGSAKLVNNIFSGKGETLRGPGELASNLINEHGEALGLRRSDYRIMADSPAIDAGTDPGSVNGVDLRPISQYIHEARSQRRPREGALDIGAYEYAP